MKDNQNFAIYRLVNFGFSINSFLKKKKWYIYKSKIYISCFLLLKVLSTDFFPVLLLFREQSPSGGRLVDVLPLSHSSRWCDSFNLCCIKGSSSCTRTELEKLWQLSASLQRGNPPHSNFNLIVQQDIIQKMCADKVALLKAFIHWSQKPEPMIIFGRKKSLNLFR